MFDTEKKREIYSFLLSHFSPSSSSSSAFVALCVSTTT